MWKPINARRARPDSQSACAEASVACPHSATSTRGVNHRRSNSFSLAAYEERGLRQVHLAADELQPFVGRPAFQNADRCRVAGERRSVNASTTDNGIMNYPPDLLYSPVTVTLTGDIHHVVSHLRTDVRRGRRVRGNRLRAANRPLRPGGAGAEGRSRSGKPWTTSKITGSPEPPPKFKSVRVFPEVKFNHPLLIARCPGTDRLFVGEQEGMLYSFANKPDAKKELFFDLRKEVKTIDKLPGAKGIGELYGLVFHPKFEENRYCYVCYTLHAEGRRRANASPDGSRVSRFTVTKTDPPRIDPASEEIVITFLGGGHNGGDLHFGPDGMLYISTGDAASPNPPDPLNTGQDCSDLLSSILRIDVDHEATAASQELRGPEGQPVRRHEGRAARDLGLRLPQPVADELRPQDRRPVGRRCRLGTVGDGPQGREGRQLRLEHHRGPAAGQAGPEARPDADPPADDRTAAHHRGQRDRRLRLSRQEVPGAVGAYIFGDWETRRIWAARFEDGRVTEMPEIVKPNDPRRRLRRGPRRRDLLPRLRHRR